MTIVATDQWWDIAGNSSVLVAVAPQGTGAGKIMSSSNSGVSWTVRTDPTSGGFFSVCWVSFLSLFVAVGESCVTSPDGVTWTERGGGSVGGYGVAASSSVIVIVGNNSVFTSTDGTSWTSRTPASPNVWQDVTYDGTLFLAVASAGTGDRAMASYGGITWVADNSAADNYWLRINDNTAVSITGTGDRVMTREVITDPKFSSTFAAFGVGGTNATTSVANTSNTVGSWATFTSSGADLPTWSNTVQRYGQNTLHCTGRYMYHTGIGTSGGADDVGSGDFCLEIDVYFTSVSAQAMIIQKAVGNGYYPWQLTLSSSQKILFLGFDNAGTPNLYLITGTTTITTGQWYRLEGTRRGNTMTLRVNGISEGTPATVSGSLYWNASSAIVVGSYDDNNSPLYYPVLGYIANGRLTKGHARYDADHSVPLHPFPLT